MTNNVTASFVILLGLSLSFIFFQCNSSSSSRSNINLPQSRGGESDIMVIMDSTAWAGPLGTVIRNTFEEDVSGLMNRSEPLFSLNYVQPRNVNSLLKRSKNIMYVTVLGDRSQANRQLRGYFTEESLQRIKQDTSLFYFIKENEFAKPQTVLHLFGESEEELIAKIQKRAESLQKFMLNKVTERITDRLKSSLNKPLMNQIDEKYPFRIMVPTTYELVKMEDNFLWIRNYDLQEDKSVYIYWQPYPGPSIFQKDSLLQLRAEIAREYVFDVQKPSIYMDLQDQELVPVMINEFSFKDMYATEISGLWMLSDESRGGPFKSFVFVDEANNRLYYMEGYIDAPARDYKRDIMRELEAIMWSFETSANSPS